MVSTRKGTMSNRRLLSQIDEFDQDNIIDNTMSGTQKNTTVNEGAADQEFTVGNADGSPAINENVVHLKILERCLNEMVDKEMGNTLDAVEHRTQQKIVLLLPK